MAKRKTSSEGIPPSTKKSAKRVAKPKVEPVKKADSVYQLKITLRDIRPPIWRRVQVKDCTLSKLHEIIQVSMGWDFAHLYSFEVNGVDYADLDMTGGELDMEDDRKAKLGRLVRGEKFKFHYTYDFGDNWEHEIVVEKILPPKRGRLTPSASTGGGPARRRTSAASGATWSSSRPCRTRNMNDTRNWRIGSMASSTPRPSTSKT